MKSRFLRSLARQNEIIKSAKDVERPTVIPGLTDKIQPINEDIGPISQDSRLSIDKSGIKRYYDSFRKLHRLDGPAVISPDGNQLWYQRGKLHREDGPAAIFFNGSQKWFLDGEELSPVEVLQLLFNSSKLTIQDIDTLKELAEIAFFNYAKTDIQAVRQAGILLQTKKIIVNKNIQSIIQFLKAATKL